MPEASKRSAPRRRPSGMTPRLYALMLVVTAATFGTLETIHRLFFTPRLFG